MAADIKRPKLATGAGRRHSLQGKVRRLRVHRSGFFISRISAQVSSRAPAAAHKGATKSCRFIAISAVGLGGSDTEAKVCAPAKMAAPSMAKAVCFIVLLWWYAFSCQLARASRLTIKTERRGRPTAPERCNNVARPRPLQ